MKKKVFMIFILLISFICIFFAICFGSVNINFFETLNTLSYKIFNYTFLDKINEVHLDIIWNLRFPRVLLAFFSGAGLAISGLIIQSILQNPLASAYTLGVSSGAGLGVSIAILLNVSIFGALTFKVFGVLFSLLTIVLILSITMATDTNFKNNSIILIGMAISLFSNAIFSLLITVSKDDFKSIIIWQMGSFLGNSLLHVFVLIFIVTLIFVLLILFQKELDIIYLGLDEAKALGIKTKNLKFNLIFLVSLLTGFIVSTVGVIGFVDLFIPHISRKIFGAKHKYILPASFILGGIFMVLCDLVARTSFSPIEIPIGVITSLIGAPFFIYLYFSKRKFY